MSLHRGKFGDWQLPVLCLPRTERCKAGPCASVPCSRCFVLPLIRGFASILKLFHLPKTSGPAALYFMVNLSGVSGEPGVVLGELV